ncbi:MAG TPA: hypothetical protein VFE84_03190 [Patescibacteria group bacterium]|nr:hypothetical protein [Patescibacteria group bacterium]
MPKIRYARWKTALSGLAWLAGLAAIAATPPASAAEKTVRGPINAIGYAIDLDNLPSPHPRPGEPAPVPVEQPGHNDEPGPSPLYLEVGIPWAQIEKTAGQYDWSVTDEIILSHAQAGYIVVPHPRGDNPLYAALSTRDQAAVDAWTGFLRALAGRYKDQVENYALGTDIRNMPARDWAYLLKLSSVMIQSADPGARVVMWGLDAGNPGAAAYLETLYGEDVSAYVDTLAITGVIGAAGATELPAIKAQIQLRDAGATIWLAGTDVRGGAEAGGRLLRGYIEGLEQEAAVSLFRIDFDQEGRPPLLPVLQRIRASFLPSYTPLVESGRGIEIKTSMGQPVTVKTVRLFNPDAKKVLIAYDAGEGTTRGAQAVMSIDTVDLADPVLKDVAAGESAQLGAWQKDEKAGLTRAAVPLADYPLVLEYRRFTTPGFGQDEKLQVTEARLPAVEEILARHQAVQTAQNSLLQNMRADARVDYHFRIGSGSTIDVTVLNNFLFDPKVGGEFEQKEFYVNGVKWRSDRMPEFPLPQPEKVMTLPLDISLDKRYSFRLVGEEKIGPYDCWSVDFTPIESVENLYKGRVWIDKQSYERVQISSVQTGLKPPIISNDEKDSYRPVRGPDGLEYWLLSRVDGQQVFSAAGRNLVMAREVDLTGYVINDAGFEEFRKQSYASSHQILRDTPAGFRYLEKTPDGGRVVKNEMDKDSLFLLGGVFYNRSLDFPLPLVGVNYFNRDVAGKGIQTNIFFAGVLMFGNLSDPALFGKKIDGSIDVFVQGFSSTDTPVSQQREKSHRNVDVISQSVTLGLGFPFADYWKAKLYADFSFQGFSQDKDTKRGTKRFIIPVDTYVSTVGFKGEFNRKGWSVVGEIEASRRSDWECWGRVCASNNPAAAPESIGDAKSYIRYDGTVAKDFFLPFNQKIHGSVTAFGGSDLDRFSEYDFGFFTNRLRGFGGTGFAYSNGTKSQLQYAFNLGSVIRFDATIDHARVKDRSAVDDGYKHFTGFGLSGQTILGPNLLVSIDWGFAAASDIKKFRGDQELLLTVLRLFH